MEPHQEHIDFLPGPGNRLLRSGYVYNHAVGRYLPIDFIPGEQPEIGQADPRRNDTLWTIEPQSSRDLISESILSGAFQTWDLADTDGHPYSNPAAWQPYPQGTQPRYGSYESRDQARWSDVTRARANNLVTNTIDGPVLDKPSIMGEASGAVSQSSGHPDFQNREFPNTMPDVRSDHNIRAMQRYNEFHPLESHGLQSLQPISGFQNDFAGKLPSGPLGSSNAFGPSAPNLVSTNVDDNPGPRQGREKPHHRKTIAACVPRRGGSDRKSSGPSRLQATHSLSSPPSTRSTTNSKPISFVWDPESDSVFEETKSKRPQSEEQRAHRMAVREAGGACAECRRKRRKCDHVLQRDNRAGAGAGARASSNRTNDHRQSLNIEDVSGWYSPGFGNDAIGIGGIFSMSQNNTSAEMLYYNGRHQNPQQISPAASPLGMIQVDDPTRGLHPYGYTRNPVQMGNLSDSSPNRFQSHHQRPY